jgi:hypothetical protein
MLMHNSLLENYSIKTKISKYTKEQELESGSAYIPIDKLKIDHPEQKEFVLLPEQLNDSIVVVPADIVEDATPAAEETTAAVEETTPAVEETTAAVEETTPAVEETTAEETTPAVVEVSENSLEETGILIDTEVAGIRQV